MSDTYYGPAGIFSTGDPVADQRQIEAEQYDPTEDLVDGNGRPVQPDDDRLFDDSEYEYHVGEEDEEPSYTEVTAWCEVGNWYLHDIIPEDNFEYYNTGAIEDHNTNCTCGNPNNFRIKREPN